MSQPGISKMEKYQEIQHSLDLIITQEREAIMSTKTVSFNVEEKTVEEILIAGIRAKPEKYLTEIQVLVEE